MLKERIRIGILMGGQSAEREVSLASGCNLVEILDRTKYEVFPIEVGEDSKWYLHHIDAPLLNSRSAIGREVPTGKSYTPPAAQHSELVTARVMRSRIDVLFLALHGPGGEDGTIQGFLETLAIPYVGSGVLASALTMDKVRCKVFLRASGLPTPEWVSFSRSEWLAGSADLVEEVLDRFPGGCVIKPNDQGSSVGMSVLGPAEDPTAAIQEALGFSGEILVERRIHGREFTCGVYGSEMPEALPVTEIRSTRTFFDYEAKYQPGGAEEITPAEIEDSLAAEIQSLAVRAHGVFGCAGITRTDFLLDESGPTILEINTIPGMTRMSLIPRACVAAGIEFETILDRVIGEALFRDQLVPAAG
ncbi:MAG: D-alanine--D-alanine ligase [Candidatus Omnitrophica bacterium]|nr:D-alanine--D-alanine ligase A [bacterium]NUN97427.1 D-alanine--D-alanine ligase [Candidatus Omnitrophota bacterium]